MNWQQQRIELMGEAAEFPLPPSIKLPILPQAVQEFGRLANDPEVSTDRLARVLESDSGLTVELLALVNSSVFGLRKKASSAKQALNLLGIQRAKMFVLTTAVKRAMSNCSSRLVNLKLFWAANLERAIFAQEVARLLNADAELAYASAMLQDFLLPILTSGLFEKYTGYFDKLPRPTPLLTTYEQQQFGWDHAVAAARIALQWEFPDEMVCGLYLHHQGMSVLMNPQFGQTSVAAGALAGLLPDVIGQNQQGLDQLIQLQTAWPKFDLKELAARTEQRFVELGGSQVHHLSLRRRLEKKSAAATEAAAV